MVWIPVLIEMAIIIVLYVMVGVTALCGFGMIVRMIVYALRKYVF